MGNLAYLGNRPLRFPYVPHSETSREAAESMSEVAGKLRLEVYKLIKDHPDGLIDQEQQDILGIGPQTQTARRRELVLQKLVEDSGRTRNTRSGRRATVWIAKNGGPE